MKSKMKSQIAGLIFAFLTATGLAAGTNTIAVIPQPQKVEIKDGVFHLAGTTTVYTDPGSRSTAEFLTERLRSGTRYPLKLSTKPFNTKNSFGAILPDHRKCEYEPRCRRL